MNIDALPKNRGKNKKEDQEEKKGFRYEDLRKIEELNRHFQLGRFRVVSDHRWHVMYNHQQLTQQAPNLLKLAIMLI